MNKYQTSALAGSCCIAVAIVGGLFWDFLAFWKMEGNVPGIIDGFVAIMPLNSLHFRTLEQPLWVAPEILVLVGIYIPFLLAALFGVFGAFRSNRRVISAAGFIGAFAVPVSMFLVPLLLGINALRIPGTEFTGLFSYFQVYTGGGR